MNEKSIFKRERTEQEARDGEVPELSSEFFRRARLSRNGQVVREGDFPARRGRPPQGDAAKVQQSLRLSPEVIEHFRATGPGWQARIDAVLREHVKAAGTAS